MTATQGPYLGVCYYPEQWPEAKWATDAANMVALGLSHVRIGEFAWALIEPEAGRFDWKWLDKAVQTLGEAGLRVIMSTPTAARNRTRGPSASKTTSPASTSSGT